LTYQQLPDDNFTLTLKGIGNCYGITVNDDMILKIDPVPVSNAGPDGTICGRNLTVIRHSPIPITDYLVHLGDGTFSNPAILNPTYTPGPNDVGTIVVLTLDLSGCKSLTDNDFMWLTVHPDPSAAINGSANICETATTPISISFTGTPPWSVTYTNGVIPVTVNNISTSPMYLR